MTTANMQHSLVRRAALTKSAAADPARLAGVLSLAAGGALGGSAATGDDQSTLKRVGKGTIGAGLAYGGYKALTDPQWQAGIRTGADTVHDIIAQLVQRIRGAAQ